MKKCVGFCSCKLEKKYEFLTDQRLKRAIDKVIALLKENPTSGIKIQKKLWPKEYVKKFSVTNLWKCDLPKGWRLVYTIKSDDEMILSLILDWFAHKAYERRFRY